MAENHEGIFDRVSEDTLERCVMMLRDMVLINKYKIHLSDAERAEWAERFLSGDATAADLALAVEPGG